ncbi:MAG: hypothetical protein A2297_09050 [Elusimicrobia bacterium RIFOXYB2_FULL_48_7]|nr:MAG: hypothetical protein A2297_09050 [Elusimicrobia bacterium RIFOXYB2_FULL_48_7]
MLIDFHTHFFPDSISKATVQKMGAHAGVAYSGNGDLKSLLDFMKKDGVDYSVNLPVATTVAQVQSINRKMIDINKKYPSGPVICFGTMHPGYSNPGEELQFLSENGVKGIKMHPEYQEFFPDDEKMLLVYEACRDYGLIISFHSGVDIAYESVHGAAKRFTELTKIKGLKFALAHAGGFRQWEDVEKYLLGKDVYIDLSYCMEMRDEQLKNILESHRDDRVLFGTDFPWERASAMKGKVEQLGLEEELKEKLYYKNAKELLKI